MKHVTFQSIASRFASTLGRHENVQVTFGGTLAYTDGKHMNLPALPAGTTMTTHQAKVFTGYLDHETAHVRFTDFNTVVKNKMDRRKEPLRFHLWNIIEDVRIENKQIETYPGAQSYLDELAKHVDKDSQQRYEPQNDNMARKLLSLIYKEAYKKYRNIDTEQIPGELGDYAEFKPIEEAMKQDMPKLLSAQMSLDLADRIIKLLPKNIDWSKNPNEQGTESGANGQGQAAEGEGGEQSLEQAAFGAPSGAGMTLEQFQQAIKNLSSEQKKKLTDALQALAQAAEQELKDKDRGEGLTQLFGEIKQQNAKETGTDAQLAEQNRKQGGGGRSKWGDKILPPMSTVNDKIFVPSQQNEGAYDATRNQLHGEITAVKKMLNVYLRSQDKRAWERGLEQGKLDQNLLFSLQFGNKRIYKEKRDRQMINTAVELMIDLSGSMDANLVRQAGIVLAESLSGVPKMKLQINGFYTGGGWGYYGTTYQPKGQTGGRLDSMNILTFKGFDDQYRDCTARLGAIASGGGTPLGEGMAYAYEALVPREEKKRVLWLISDGEPAFSCQDPSHNDFLLMKQVQIRCRNAGILLVGLGIRGFGGLQLKGYVDYYEQITSCAELPQAVLSIMKEVIAK